MSENIITQKPELSNQEIFCQLQFIRQRLALLIEAVSPQRPTCLIYLVGAETELASAVQQLDKQAAEAAIRELLADDPAACWNSAEAGR